ncbi:MAG TPA: transporter [Ensifer sp.]|uniref:SphA family protein n=1 Tax=Ensifer sp. TaxID=1872086 RepID=UPI002E162BF9|nr:transporter [Ensifer sp.]
MDNCLAGGLRATVLGLAALAGVAAMNSPLSAAESGTSIYLLGSAGPTAAIMPPLVGLYFQNDIYLYRGSAGANRNFSLGGNVAAKLDANVFLEMPTFVFVPTTAFLGGTLAFAASFPIGGPKITAGALLRGPRGGALGAKTEDSIFTFGDPYVSSFIGWKSGNFHWQVGASANVPIGDYREDALANVSFNRWMGDFFGAATWLDPAIGLDVSGKIGLSVNGENPSTNYRSGNDFHAEWAVVQHFSKTFSAGLVGYHYQQLTGDSGAGATLGAFKGRVTALGGTVGYDFMIGKLPISTRIKVYREFNVENRLRGTVGFLTVSMPLYVK